MRRILSVLALSSGLAFAAPALAQSSQKFENTYGVPVNSVKIEVSLADALAHLAENPAEGIDRRRAAFGTGNYGEKDLNRLVQRLEKKLTKRLEKEGVTVDENSANVLNIQLTEVRNNRPTFEQLSSRTNLSYSSFGSGGASFSGTLTTDNGESGGDISYAYYESLGCNVGGNGTWTDSNRAIDRFARHTAKSLAWVDQDDS